MGGGFQFFDIILFAMIAVFLILRLRSALGRRDGHEGGYKDIFSDPRKDHPPHDETRDNIVHLPEGAHDTDFVPPARDEDTFEPEPEVFEGPAIAGLEEIRRANPNFSAKEFTEGARSAFEMILAAYANGDTRTLKPLLGADVYGNFENAIEEREANGESLEETLVGITSAEIVEAGLNGEQANITVKFVSEQISVLRDKAGEVIDGDPTKIIHRVDFWTFSRNPRSRNPNWALIETHSPQ